MKKLTSLIIVVMLALCAPLFTAADTGIGTSVSYSAILTTHEMRSAFPISPEVYFRFFDLLEAGIFGAYGSDTAKRFESYWSIITGAELRLAPAGRFYMPYAGLGVSYSYYDYSVVLPNDHAIAGFVSIAPLRFTIKPFFRYGAEIHPVVSVLQIRYGPFYYDGGLPSWYDLGNFFAMIDLVRVGVYFGL